MTLADYKKPITASFARHARGGFADWRHCGMLYHEVTAMLEEAAEELAGEGRYADLFKLSNWAFVKWDKTNKDDSYGESEGFCSCITEIWETVYLDGEADLSHGKMLEALLKDLDGRFVDDMDDVYGFVLTHFKAEEELAQKEAFLLGVIEDLKRRIPEDDILKYSLDTAEEYYIKVLADQRRPIEEIRDLLGRGGSLGKRTAMARIELDYGNTEEAIEIIRAILDEFPGGYRMDPYRRTLMEIYKRRGDTAAYNEQLYQMMMAHPGEEEYFLKYKALFSEEEWGAVWASILEQWKGYLYPIRAWLWTEGRYDLLMDCAEPNLTEVVEAYGEKLFELYPERCLGVLENAANWEAQTARDRRGYRKLAGMLRKISKYPGGKELAAALAARYRAMYPRRTSMLEELKRF